MTWRPAITATVDRNQHSEKTTMTRSMLVFFVPLVAALLIGCDFSQPNYQIVRAGDQTFLLETSSGQVQYIDGDTLSPIGRLNETPSEKRSTPVRVWPEESIPQLGELTLT